jgi:hypothetical protein
MHFDRRLGFAKLGPREQGEAEINSRRVEREQRLFQLNGKWLVPVKLLGDSDQNVTEVLKYSPIAALIAIGKRCPRNGAAKSNMVELISM